MDGVTFSIEKGRTMGLVGESGCGKTTVGRTILKLYQATAGRILYQGTDITGLSDSQMVPYRKKMQMIFQDPMTALNPVFTVGYQINESLLYHDRAKTKSEAKQKAIRLLKDMGIPLRCQTADGGLSVRAVGRYVPEGYHSHVRVQQTADDHCG